MYFFSCYVYASYLLVIISVSMLLLGNVQKLPTSHCPNSRPILVETCSIPHKYLLENKVHDGK